jgi:hypothetical protein
LPTVVIQVAAVTSPDQWVLGAGANKVVAVNGPDDEDTTYIQSTTTLTEQYSLAAAGIAPGSAINSVSVVSRVRFSAGSARTWRVDLKLGGNTTSGPNHTSAAAYASYSDTLGRPGGGAWSLADLATLEVAIVQTAAGAGAVQRCTSLWLIVDYTPPSAAGNMLLMFR